MKRIFLILVLAACAGPSASVQRPFPERAVRRDIPMQPGIRRAHLAGTRDSTGRPGPRYWQQKVDYVINATLDPATSVVSGTQSITLHNTSPDTLPQIVMRLYQNYFTPRVERTDYITDLTDGMIIERLAVNGAAIPLNNSARYRLNERIATITPSSPVLPGQSVKLDLRWRFTVPAVDTAVRGQRMGRYGTRVYQVAQWYPQIAMYDDLRGWDTDQYLGNGEFYNQFGSFDVRITVPGGWLVGATGDLQNPEAVLSRRTRDRLALAMEVDTTVHVVRPDEIRTGTASGRTLTWHFKAPMVNDFAFAASRDYVYEATHATIPGKGKIPVHVLYLPEHTRYRSLNTARYGREALEYFSRWFFPYEFSQGTIADGPETGMEYPMIIFNGSSRGVTTHEFAHQWFPMTVGSNETRYGFMDESFVQWASAVAIGAITSGPVDHVAGTAAYRRIAGSELEAPMMWPADLAGAGTGVSVYTKGRVALYALGGIVGDTAVYRAMSEYAQAWKYKHPTPWDFFFSMNRSLRRNLDWFWYGWFFTTGTFDQAIESVKTSGGAADIAIRDKGDLAMPVVLRLEFSDGSTQLVTHPAEVWFAGDRRYVSRVPLRGRVLRAVVLDPEGRFQDIVPGDNRWGGAR
jgi:hypothetical protein